MDWTNLIADTTQLVPVHYTPGRAGRAIDRIVLHHNAGNLSVEGCYNTWLTREASAHYQVEASGRIGQLVNDSDTAWHAGNQDWNRRSIGIEHANNTFAPSWTVGETTLDQGAHLTAALCRYYGLGAPTWHVNVFGHHDANGSECPGALYGSQNAAYMSRAQAWYKHMTAGAPAPSGGATASGTIKIEEEDMAFIQSCVGRGEAVIAGGRYLALPNTEYAQCVRDTWPGIEVRAVNARQFDLNRSLTYEAPTDLSAILKAIQGIGSKVGVSDEAIQQIVEAVAEIQAADVAAQLEVGVKA